MSIKTLRKRIALVAVSALGVGLLSVAPASATAGDITFQTANGPVIVAAGGTVTAGTITVGSSTSVQLQFTAGTDDAGKATVEGGTIVAASAEPDTGISTATSFVYGNDSNTKLTFLPDAGVGVMIIRSYADGSTESATFTVTVKAAASIGKISAANSIVRVADSTSDSDVASNVDSSTGGKTPAAGTNARINYSLKDGNNVAMPSTTSFSATATGGCVVGTSNTAASLIATTYSELAASGEFYVARSTSNAPFTCTISMSANGVSFATKTVTLQGKVTKLEVLDGDAGISLAYASSSINSGVSEEAFAYNAYDAAGNVVYSVSPTFVNVATDAFSSAAVNTAAAIATGYGTGDVTCTGNAKGTGSFYMTYSNNVGETIISPTYTVKCYGGAVNYKASLDKATYAPGDIATLTITATDSKGNPANDYLYLSGTSAAGATVTTASKQPSIAGSNLTAVTAPTGADMFSGGKKTYKYVVGTTEGSYQMVVDLPAFNSTTYSQAAVSIAYSIKAPATGAVSNAEVLAAIVKLIASINKQIRALQKSLKR